MYDGPHENTSPASIAKRCKRTELHEHLEHQLAAGRDRLDQIGAEMRQIIAKPISPGGSDRERNETLRRLDAEGDELRQRLQPLRKALIEERTQYGRAVYAELRAGITATARTGLEAALQLRESMCWLRAADDVLVGAGDAGFLVLPIPDIDMTITRLKKLGGVVEP